MKGNPMEKKMQEVGVRTAKLLTSPEKMNQKVQQMIAEGICFTEAAWHLLEDYARVQWIAPADQLKVSPDANLEKLEAPKASENTLLLVKSA